MRYIRVDSLLIVVAALLASGAAQHAAAQTPCPSAAAARGHIGITMGCDCTVNATPSAERPWRFRSPILVTAVEPGGAADGRLRVGDVIVSIDGTDITTDAGARHLAEVAPGQTVRLEIVRAGERRVVEVRADAICPHDPRAIGSYAPAVVTPGGRVPTTPGRTPVPTPRATPPGATPPAGPPRAMPSPTGRPVPTMPDLLPPGHVGFALSCAGCGWERERGDALPRWHSNEPPRIYAVEPNGPAAVAGLEPGDVLIAVDGHAITSPAGGAALGAAAPGRALRLTLRRGARTFDVALTPRARAAAPVPGQDRYVGSFGGVNVHVTSATPASVSVTPAGDVMRIVVNGTVVELTVPRGGSR